ncbi:MAG: hypothetical protein UIL73_03820 [Anaerovoracaceae bacterium]|nr:hypothetical protein [Anaerovoracaceae bacterium]
MMAREDMLMLSNLLDEKLKPIDFRFDQMEQRFDRMDQRLIYMDKRLDKVEKRLDDVDKRFEQIDKRFEGIDRQLAEVDRRLTRVEGSIDQMGRRIERVELVLENDVVPRLHNIESCYVSTYDRYVAKAEEIDGLKTDMEIVKNVLIDHDEKLKVM